MEWLVVGSMVFREVGREINEGKSELRERMSESIR